MLKKILHFEHEKKGHAGTDGPTEGQTNRPTDGWIDRRSFRARPFLEYVEAGRRKKESKVE